MKLAAAIAAIGLAAAPAHAEGRKDETVAFALSASGTLASAGLLVYSARHQSNDAFTAAAIGLAITPSLGHWYAGDFFTGAMAARAAGATAVVLGYTRAGCDGGPCEGGAALMVFGAGTFVAGVLWDVATAPRAARRWNTRHDMAIVPTVTPGGAGLSLGGAF